ncbi:SpoIIE family protein phosphatase [Streptomyces sp. JJ38]|uniref:SpoIIE family protein phosphatase n=1 Tax=Streptomyces sp. JJ38 TaxID=2738128 RepID=UPI001C568C75|nr:SpoIIE family protein phosphatase [Streptomyces sp. JJ38]MBW1598362.1 SpoIIE family protein phosphatase [Streptomyces sp. JJ38]
MAQALSGKFADALVRLLSCPDPDNLLAEAAIAVAPHRRHAAGVLHWLDQAGSLTIVAAAGLPDAYLDAYRVVPVDSWIPCARAVRENRPVYTTVADHPLPDVYPADLGIQPMGADAEFVSVPLLLDSVCLGALSLRVPTGSALDSANEQRLMALANACAHRWERMRHGSGGVSTERSGEHRLPPPALAVGQQRTTMLEKALSNAGLGMFDWDFTSGRVVWDERSCRLFGVRPEEFDGRIETFDALVHPDDRAQVEAAVEESYETGRYEVTYRVARPDGAVRWIHAESRLVYDSEGRPLRMTGIVQDRTDEHERAAARRARSEFILALTRSLAAALSTEDVVSAVAATTLRELGGATMAVFLRRENGVMRLAGSRGYDREQEERLRSLGEVMSGHPLYDEVWEGNPLFLESQREYRERFPDTALASPRGGATHAWAILPLISAQGLVGTCVFGYNRPRGFSPDDRTVYTAAAGIMAQALTRARLYDARREDLTELQELMLPGALPELPGLDVAVRYRPGDQGLDVGGDWYDVLRLPEGRAALIIGDVQGHSARAAAVMGQMRTAMRTRATENHIPSELMAGANRTLCELDTDLFATCAIAEVDPAAGRLRLVRAGHPHPMVVRADGTVREVEVRGGMPLGCFPDDEYPVAETELAPGDALLLYTDGLVEVPGIDYSAGVRRLAERLSRHHRGPLEELADRLVAPAVARSPKDDIAVVLLRLGG